MDRLKRVRFTLPILLIFLLYSCATQIAAPKPFKDIPQDCSRSESIQVFGKEFFYKGDSYSQIKENLIDQLLLDAVEQVVGIEIRRQANSKIEFDGDNINDEYKEISSEKAKGYILSYSVPDKTEEIVKEQGVNLLKLSVIAEVCIPKERFLRDVVAFGDIVWSEMDNTEFIHAKDLASTAYFENSKFDIVKEDSKEIYHDWILSGRLVSTSATERHSVLRSFTKSLLGSVYVNGDNMDKNYSSNVIHVEIKTYMELKNVMDGKILSSTNTMIRDFPSSYSDADLANKIDTVIEDSFLESTKGVFQKLVKYK